MAPVWTDGYAECVERMVRLRDRNRLESYLRRYPGLNLFRIADLDPREWPKTTWYARIGRKDVQALALMHDGHPPLLVLYADGRSTADAWHLLQELKGRLPSRFIADLSPGLRKGLSPEFRAAERGEGAHLRMVLASWRAVKRTDTSQVEPIGLSHIRELRALYRRAYPKTFFSTDHLRLGFFRGIRRNGRLVAAGGLLVYSHRYGVAALGNIATHPDFRRQGLGTMITARICRDLRRKVDLIGLCVLARNRAAIGCYRKLGFRATARTEVMYVTARRRIARTGRISSWRR